MRIEDVRAAIEAIRALDYDSEQMHGDEDDLHRRVLAATADGTCEDPRGCAAETLKTGEIKFERWYA